MFLGARVYALVCMGAREGSVYGNRGLYGSVLVRGACRAVWVSAGILSQDEEHTLGQWCGWEALMRHVVSWGVFEGGSSDGVTGPHPCGSILKLAWCYWGLASDPIAGVGVLGTGGLLSFTFLLLLLVAMSVPKKKRRMKELNKKEAVGDLLDAFKEVSVLGMSGGHPVSHLLL